jgi:hypothetical protein
LLIASNRHCKQLVARHTRGNAHASSAARYKLLAAQNQTCLIGAISCAQQAMGAIESIRTRDNFVACNKLLAISKKSCKITVENKFKIQIQI